VQVPQYCTFTCTHGTGPHPRRANPRVNRSARGARVLEFDAGDEWDAAAEPMPMRLIDPGQALGAGRGKWLRGFVGAAALVVFFLDAGGYDRPSLDRASGFTTSERDEHAPDERTELDDAFDAWHVIRSHPGLEDATKVRETVRSNEDKLFIPCSCCKRAVPAHRYS
jgi:hypothetical protein